GVARKGRVRSFTSEAVRRRRDFFGGPFRRPEFIPFLRNECQARTAWVGTHPDMPRSPDTLRLTTGTGGGKAMSGTYKKIEIVGTSSVSFADAVKSAVQDAGKTVRHMDWFEVVEMRGRIHDSQVAEYQVTVRIGFKLER